MMPPRSIPLACVCALCVQGAPYLPTSPATPEFFYSIRNTSNTVWIAPPVWKVMKDAAAPTNTAGAIILHAARNEYEPVQIIVKPAAPSTVRLAVGAWSGPGPASALTAELHRVCYVPITTIRAGDQYGYPGEWPDPLYPHAFGAPLAAAAHSNQPFWLTVYAATNAPPGVYSNTVSITMDSATFVVPLQVTVFRFMLPLLPSFDAFANYSDQRMGGADSLARRDAIKRWWYAHRIAPQNPCWPSGFRWNIVWENPAKGAGTNAPPVDEFDTESNPNYRVRELAHKYVMGHGFNGVGFPSFQALQFVDNSTPRPATFAGAGIGATPYGTEAYNQKWGAYLKALQDYFDPSVPYNPPHSYGNPYTNNYLPRAWYYVMNEPQTDSDCTLAAHLARIARHYAPKLRIGVSEEPKPKIYANTNFPGLNCGYDLWIANISCYNTAVSNAWLRRLQHGEKTYWYSLGHDMPPFVNPIRINHPALEPRLLAWLAWNFRIEGFTYYSWNNWAASTWDDPDRVVTGDNGEGFLLYPEPGTSEARTNFIPSIRLELLREGFEDYEYFVLANSNATPVPGQPNAVDTAIAGIVPAMCAYQPDPAATMWLRRETGLYLDGARAALPSEVPCAPPRHELTYHINFQNPAGMPTNNPLIVNNVVWEKFGWAPYDPTGQIGWISDDMGISGRLIENYDQWDDGDLLQKSCIYNNWGGRDVFLLGIPNGIYTVEVGVGYRSQRPQMVSVNGVPLIGDHNAGAMALPPGPPNYHMAASTDVYVRGGMLAVEIGRRQSDADLPNEWTFLNYVSITAVPECSLAIFLPCASALLALTRRGYFHD